ncbi:conserved hypothetical protein [Neospora caninum Liverpool]|uniref:Uncharacterized protein n=1 Tax=Neospora caninum (strain Liverpool) TaxID=572307 RepID=F0VE40_NEOCL|nr:conserved hypothetical protein [Neospora caninum Liverpool]CBZ51983.1 conserved hypothetical protein [Neospora caninum Liverpool]|eukprot:XP_003882016.1 conserved hypothetical protein [Neospora caninum Liverpool]
MEDNSLTLSSCCSESSGAFEESAEGSEHCSCSVCQAQNPGGEEQDQSSRNSDISRHCSCCSEIAQSRSASSDGRTSTEMEHQSLGLARSVAEAVTSAFSRPPVALLGSPTVSVFSPPDSCTAAEKRTLLRMHQQALLALANSSDAVSVRLHTSTALPPGRLKATRRCSRGPSRGRRSRTTSCKRFCRGQPRRRRSREACSREAGGQARGAFAPGNRPLSSPEAAQRPSATDTSFSCMEGVCSFTTASADLPNPVSDSTSSPAEPWISCGGCGHRRPELDSSCSSGHEIRAGSPRWNSRAERVRKGQNKRSYQGTSLGRRLAGTEERDTSYLSVRVRGSGPSRERRNQNLVPRSGSHGCANANRISQDATIDGGFVTPCGTPVTFLSTGNASSDLSQNVQPAIVRHGRSDGLRGPPLTPEDHCPVHCPELPTQRGREAAFVVDREGTLTGGSSTGQQTSKGRSNLEETPSCHTKHEESFPLDQARHARSSERQPEGKLKPLEDKHPDCPVHARGIASPTRAGRTASTAQIEVAFHKDRTNRSDAKHAKTQLEETRGEAGCRGQKDTGSRELKRLPGDQDNSNHTAAVRVGEERPHLDITSACSSYPRKPLPSDSPACVLSPPHRQCQPRHRSRSKTQEDSRSRRHNDDTIATRSLAASPDDLADAEAYTIAAIRGQISSSEDEPAETRKLRDEVATLVKQHAQEKRQTAAAQQMLAEAEAARAAAEQQLHEAEKTQQELHAKLGQAEETLEGLLEQVHELERTETALRDALAEAQGQKAAAERQLEERTLSPPVPAVRVECQEEANLGNVSGEPLDQEALATALEDLKAGRERESQAKQQLEKLQAEVTSLERRLATAVREKVDALEAVAEYRELLEQQRSQCEALREQLSAQACQLTQSEQKARRLSQSAEEQVALLERVHQIQAQQKQTRAKCRMRQEQLETALMAREEVLQRQNEDLLLLRLSEAETSRERDAATLERQASSERHAFQCEELQQWLWSLSGRLERQKDVIRQKELTLREHPLSRQQSSERHRLHQEDLEERLFAEHLARLQSREERQRLEEEIAELRRQQANVRRALQELEPGKKRDAMRRLRESRTADFRFVQSEKETTERDAGRRSDDAAMAAEGSTPEKLPQAAHSVRFGVSELLRSQRSAEMTAVRAQVETAEAAVRVLQDELRQPEVPRRCLDVSRVEGPEAEASEALKPDRPGRASEESRVLLKVLGWQITAAAERLGAARCREREFLAQVAALEQGWTARNFREGTAAEVTTGAALQRCLEGRKMLQEDLEASLWQLERGLALAEAERDREAQAAAIAREQQALLEAQKQALERLEEELRSKTEAEETVQREVLKMVRRIQELEVSEEQGTERLADCHAALAEAMRQLRAAEQAERELRETQRRQLEQRKEAGLKEEAARREEQAKTEEALREGAKTVAALLVSKLEGTAAAAAKVQQLQCLVAEKEDEIGNLVAELESKREALEAEKSRHEAFQALLRTEQESSRQLEALHAAWQVDGETLLEMQTSLSSDKPRPLQMAVLKQLQSLAQHRERHCEDQDPHRDPAEDEEAAEAARRGRREMERQVVAVVQALQQEARERRTMRIEELEGAVRELERQRDAAEQLASQRGPQAKQLLQELEDQEKSLKAVQEERTQLVEEYKRETEEAARALAVQRLHWQESRERWQLQHEAGASREEELARQLETACVAHAGDVEQLELQAAEAERALTEEAAKVAQLRQAQADLLAQQGAERAALVDGHRSREEALQRQIHLATAELASMRDRCEAAETHLHFHRAREQALAAAAARGCLECAKANAFLAHLSAAEQREHQLRLEKTTLKHQLDQLQEERREESRRFQRLQQEQEKVHAAQLEELLGAQELKTQHHAQAAASALAKTLALNGALRQLEKADCEAVWLREDRLRLQREVERTYARLAELQSSEHQLLAQQEHQSAAAAAGGLLLQIEARHAFRRLEAVQQECEEVTQERRELEAELQRAREAERMHLQSQQRAFEDERLQHEAALCRLRSDLLAGQRLLEEQLETERAARLREQQVLQQSSQLLLLRLHSTEKRLKDREEAAAAAESRAAAVRRLASEDRAEGESLKAEVARLKDSFQRSQALHADLRKQFEEERLELQSEVAKQKLQAEEGLQRLEALEALGRERVERHERELAAAREHQRALLEEAFEAQRRDQEKVYREQLELELQTQREEAERSFAREKEALMEAHSRALLEREKQIEAQRKEFEATVETQRADCEQRLLSSEATHAKLLEEHLAKQREALEDRQRTALEAHLERQRTELGQQRREVEAQLDAELTQSREALQAQKEAFETELAAQKAKLHEQLEGIQTHQELLLQQQRDQQQAEFRRQLAEQEAELERRRDKEIAAAIAQQRAEWQAQLEEALDEMRTHLQDKCRRQHEQDLARRLLEKEREIQEALSRQRLALEKEMDAKLAQAEQVREAEKRRIQDEANAFVLERQVSCEKRLRVQQEQSAEDHAHASAAQQSELWEAEQLRFDALKQPLREECERQLQTEDVARSLENPNLASQRETRLLEVEDQAVASKKLPRQEAHPLENHTKILYQLQEAEQQQIGEARKAKEGSASRGEGLAAESEQESSVQKQNWTEESLPELDENGEEKRGRWAEETRAEKDQMETQVAGRHEREFALMGEKREACGAYLASQESDASKQSSQKTLEELATLKNPTGASHQKTEGTPLAVPHPSAEKLTPALESNGAELGGHAIARNKNDASEASQEQTAGVQGALDRGLESLQQSSAEGRDLDQDQQRGLSQPGGPLEGENAGQGDWLRTATADERESEVEAKLAKARGELQLQLEAKLAVKELELRAQLHEELQRHRTRFAAKMKEKEREAEEKLQRLRDARRGSAERARSRQLQLERQLQELQGRERALRAELERHRKSDEPTGASQEQFQATRPLEVTQGGAESREEAHAPERLSEARAREQELREAATARARMQRSEDALQLCLEDLATTRRQLEESRRQEAETRRALASETAETERLRRQLADATQQRQPQTAQEGVRSGRERPRDEGVRSDRGVAATAGAEVEELRKELAATSEEKKKLAKRFAEVQEKLEAEKVQREESCEWQLARSEVKHTDGVNLHVSEITRLENSEEGANAGAELQAQDAEREVESRHGQRKTVEKREVASRENLAAQEATLDASLQEGPEETEVGRETHGTAKAAVDANLATTRAGAAGITAIIKRSGEKRRETPEALDLAQTVAELTRELDAKSALVQKYQGLLKIKDAAALRRSASSQEGRIVSRDSSCLCVLVEDQEALEAQRREAEELARTKADLGRQKTELKREEERLQRETEKLRQAQEAHARARDQLREEAKQVHEEARQLQEGQAHFLEAQQELDRRQASLERTRACLAVQTEVRHREEQTPERPKGSAHDERVDAKETGGELRPPRGELERAIVAAHPAQAALREENAPATGSEPLERDTPYRLLPTSPLAEPARRASAYISLQKRRQTGDRRRRRSALDLSDLDPVSVELQTLQDLVHQRDLEIQSFAQALLVQSKASRDHLSRQRPLSQQTLRDIAANSALPEGLDPFPRAGVLSTSKRSVSPERFAERPEETPKRPPNWFRHQDGGKCLAGWAREAISPQAIQTMRAASYARGVPSAETSSDARASTEKNLPAAPRHKEGEMMEPRLEAGQPHDGDETRGGAQRRRRVESPNAGPLAAPRLGGDATRHEGRPVLKDVCTFAKEAERTGRTAHGRNLGNSCSTDQETLELIRAFWLAACPPPAVESRLLSLFSPLLMYQLTHYGAWTVMPSPVSRFDTVSSAASLDLKSSTTARGLVSSGEHERTRGHCASLGAEQACLSPVPDRGLKLSPSLPPRKGHSPCAEAPVYVLCSPLVSSYAALLAPSSASESTAVFLLSSFGAETAQIRVQTVQSFLPRREQDFPWGPSATMQAPPSVSLCSAPTSRLPGKSSEPCQETERRIGPVLVRLQECSCIATGGVMYLEFSLTKREGSEGEGRRMQTEDGERLSDIRKVDARRGHEALPAHTPCRGSHQGVPRARGQPWPEASKSPNAPARRGRQSLTRTRFSPSPQSRGKTLDPLRETAAAKRGDRAFSLHLVSLPTDDGLVWFHFLESGSASEHGQTRRETHTSLVGRGPQFLSSVEDGASTAFVRGRAKPVKIQHALTGLFMKLSPAETDPSESASRRIQEEGYLEPQIAALVTYARERGAFEAGAASQLQSQSDTRRDCGYRVEEDAQLLGKNHVRTAIETFERNREHGQMRGLRGTHDPDEATVFLLVEQDELRQRTMYGRNRLVQMFQDAFSAARL